jgi:hypothetical protein
VVATRSSAENASAFPQLAKHHVAAMRRMKRVILKSQSGEIASTNWSRLRKGKVTFASTAKAPLFL